MIRRAKSEAWRAREQALYQVGIFVILALLIVFFGIMNPRFLTLRNLVNVLQQSAPLGIAVIGITFVMLTAGIDISVGSVMFLSGTAAAYMFDRLGVTLPVGFIVAVSVSVLIGVSNGILIARFKLVPFITTIAMLSVARGLALFISRSRGLYFGEASAIIARFRFLGLPFSVWMFLVFAVIGQYVLKRTQYGRHLYALGNDYHGAETTGIRVRSIVFSVYVISSVAAGIAGFLSAAQVSAVSSNFAFGNEFVIIPAAVIGGTSLFGGKGQVLPNAAIGIGIIVIIFNGLTFMDASPFVYTIVRGAVIFLAVMVDSLRNTAIAR